LKVNLAGRVRNTSLVVSRPLLPLFDAIVNSVHAIEDRQPQPAQPLITITVEREKVLPDQDPETGEVSGFVVTDNGIGFNEDNYDSFGTSDSPWKQARGAKGVGRFLWLKAFGDVRVESAFISDAKELCLRKFRFHLPEGIAEPTCEPIAEGEGVRVGATIQLRQFLPEYRAHTPRRLEAIADKILEHCLVYFLTPTCPRILLQDAEHRVDLNARFRDRTREVGEPVGFKVNGCDLTARHFHAAVASMHHRVVYTAHGREVFDEALQLPDLVRHLKEEDGSEFVLATCVAGRVLDAAVNQERTGFNLLVDGAVLQGQLTLSDLKAAARDQVCQHLEPYLAPIREAKVAEYERVIQEEYPHYRPLIRHRAEELRQMPAGLVGEKLEVELHRLTASIEIATKRSIRELMRDATTMDDYDGRLGSVLAQVNELGTASLAKHVAHRRTVLEILGHQLALQETGKYSLEEQVHRIIFPLRCTSDEVVLENQNLWIIDDRLTFHQYLASDLPISLEELSRPDLAIWNNPVSLSEEIGPTLGAVTILEFKRPQRRDYTGDDKDPIAQVFGYIRCIRDGRAKTRAGRPLTVTPNTPFYAYILADLTPKLRECAENASMLDTPDRQGYFGYNKNLGCYIEVLSYEKVIDDARKRNRAFFEALHLPTHPYGRTSGS
jgi:hypothetical protein